MGAQTHCKRGHSLEGENLYVYPDGRRLCRPCNRASGRKSDKKRKRDLEAKRTYCRRYRERNREKIRAYNKEYERKNGAARRRDPKRRDYMRRYGRNKRLVDRYGITQEEYLKMKEEQGGVCAICGEEETAATARSTRNPLRVDHCHETEEVRGLLCHNCNAGIGHFKDDPDRLRAAIEYLGKA